MLWEKRVSQYTSCCISDDIIACVDGCSGAVYSSTIEMTVPPISFPSAGQRPGREWRESELAIQFINTFILAREVCASL